ncbi:MAG: methyltransferase domain-containing protein [Spirochaetales bacterium]|nr:methyltransferase domain-containing protein [Spirochaetales bacterium]
MIVSEDTGSDRWDFIIIDYRKTPGSLFDYFRGRGSLIGIDEGGDYRSEFQFLIDILPSLPNRIQANISSPGLLNLPPKHEYLKVEKEYKKILITFGGEDPLDLTSKILMFIQKYGYFRSAEITVVTQSSSMKESGEDRLKILISPENLKDMLVDYDLIITSFGITTFESLSSGVPFLLLNPERYHEKLSIFCGFPTLGVVLPEKKRMDKFLKSGVSYLDLQQKYITRTDQNLGNIIGNLKKGKTNCPVCTNSGFKNKIICRTGAGTYYKCRRCRIIYLLPLISSSNSYRKEYFFEEYKKQYGRTYLEDFRKIKTFAAERLNVINTLGKKSQTGSPSLLDVGCAYGPFLAEAEYFGYTPEGVEIIPEAAEYVRSNLGFPVFSTCFEELETEKQFDLLTMWYVIEHFDKLDSVLIQVNKLLKSGAVFAFSTPGSKGISGLKDLKSFLRGSPSDHITVWSTRAAKKILPGFGFRIRKIRITGHHPERFPFFRVLELIFGEKGILILSKLFKLGDTFEVYAEKIREYNG